MISFGPTTENNVVVIFHHPCPDGFTSAWVANKFLPPETTRYIGMTYGEVIPFDELYNKRIFLLDFSFKKEVIEDLLPKVKYLTVLDHHKTAEADLRNLQNPIYKNLEIIFDMNHSGCKLTWNYFKNRNPKSVPPEPWLLGYIEDRDLWAWKLKDSKEIGMVIATYDFTFQEFDNLEQLGWIGMNQIADNGRTLIRYKDQLIKRLLEHAYPYEIDGHQTLIVNTPTFQSEIGEAICEKGFKLGITYFEEKDIIRYSLRSREINGEILDVSEIAKRRGGGGHRQAAGFEVKKS